MASRLQLIAGTLELFAQNTNVLLQGVSRYFCLGGARLALGQIGVSLGLVGQISRDFNTIATGSSVDSTSVNVSASFSFNRKLELNTGVSYGRNLFLGAASHGRQDEFFSWDAGAGYKLNEHLRLGASYTYFRNWSSFSFSNFQRQSYSLDITSHF